MSWETLLLHASQPFVEFLQVRQKPHLGATVGFVHKIFERAALSHVSRDVAQDHEAPSVRHEFLNDVTRKTCLESEKMRPSRCIGTRINSAPCWMASPIISRASRSLFSFSPPALSDLRQIILARGTEALSINYQRKELRQKRSIGVGTDFCC